MSLLGELELKVIRALRNIKEGTIRQICEELKCQYEDENIPYTTISTVLSRLAEKHLVQVREERFRKNQIRLVYIYEEIEDKIIDDLLYQLIETFDEGIIKKLIERLEEFSPEELSNLELLKTKLHLIS